jgi:regulator of protease activity HflC (stomatin/prohibitin superfamily)
MLPWDLMIQYDRRLQSKDYDVTALTKGGLSVSVNMSVLWFLRPENASVLHVEAGPDYRERVIDPAVISAVRSVIGSYEQSDLYDGNPLQLQNEVLGLLNETLVNAPFSIHSILVRRVSLPDKMSAAISEKFVAEQAVLAERYRVLEAIESFKKNYVDAEGTRLEQAVITEGLSEEYLRYAGILATLDLAKSDNAKLVIIGDKDGLPLILNPDTLETSPALTEDGLAPEEYIRPGQEGARREELLETYDRLRQQLAVIDEVLGSLEDEFPAADAGIGDSALPQVNQVPVTPDTAKPASPIGGE